MLTAFEVREFKGFERLRLEQLAQVNLITGANNVGKSALLEALALFATRGQLTDEVISFREISRSVENSRTSRDWLRWVRRQDSIGPAKIEGQMQSGGSRLVWPFLDKKTIETLVTKRGGRFEEGLQSNQFGSKSWTSVLGESESLALLRVVPAWPVGRGALLQAYESAMLNPKAELLIERWLRQLDARVVNIRSLQIGDYERQLYVDIGGSERIPLSHLGQGAQRIVLIGAQGCGCRDGLLLIDEIETGLHYSVLAQFWRGIFAMAADMNLQLFATHSYECLQAAARVAKELPGRQLAVHRLERNEDGSIAAVSGDEDTIGAALEAGMEVR